METTIELAHQAFNFYKSQDYKSALKFHHSLFSNLGKISSLKESKDKSYFRISHNVLLCEYMQNRITTSGNVLRKLG